MIPSWSPISTQTTQTRAAAISDPIAIQMAERMSFDDICWTSERGVLSDMLILPAMVIPSCHAAP
ncbi:hypothetical protein MIAR_19790 [Microbacterium arabinogalactanolyticum]|nr:hypothetical protein MIAR_19790 [Microbacterium arabinogalactanolyticum]